MVVTVRWSLRRGSRLTTELDVVLLLPTVSFQSVGYGLQVLAFVGPMAVRAGGRHGHSESPGRGWSCGGMQTESAKPSREFSRGRWETGDTVTRGRFAALDSGIESRQQVMTPCLVEVKLALVPGRSRLDPYLRRFTFHTCQGRLTSDDVRGVLHERLCRTDFRRRY